VSVEAAVPEAEAYVASAVTETLPSNLPTSEAAFARIDDTPDESAELTELENQAHAQKILLSSDAMRYFVTKVANVEEHSRVLDVVIEKARISFPSEEGWVVINLARMQELMDEVNQADDALVSEDQAPLTTFTSPIVAGSLAEAVLTGNTLAAYEMISHRPMVALSDAASDLDAVYRSRRGEQVNISNMLKMEAAKLSDEQLKEVIAALTSALDGTYTNEEDAVKMAIMKAIKAVA